MNTYDHFHSAIKSLIYLNRQFRRSHDSEKYLSLYEYLSEFGVVSANIGRQTGKSRFILDTATYADLVITHSEISARRFKDDVRGGVNTPSIISASSLDRVYISRNPSTFDVVYVDEPSRIAASIDVIRSCIYAGIVNHKSTFVLLG